ncbi:MAG: TPR end-of-group domain-containing protein [Aristaeellaceae bacterium]
MRSENDLLEETLAMAERSYGEAYRYLLGEYEKSPGHCGPQTLYFLACLAGGSHQPEQALDWLRRAVMDNGWWYRPEVLEDDDLSSLRDNAAFLAVKAVSDQRYAEAVSKARAACSWHGKTADKLFLAVHGNTQNAQTAREDWAAVLNGDSRWQLETIQSAEPDGYGTYRWRYDSTSFLPVAQAMEQAGQAGYGRLVCGGFSAGCDMLLRAVTLSPAACDMLLLQSPWLPFLHEQGEAAVHALRHKGIALNILCGSEDADCLPCARQLAGMALQAGVTVALAIQPGCRHQFPRTPLALPD